MSSSAARNRRKVSPGKQNSEGVAPNGAASVCAFCLGLSTSLGRHLTAPSSFIGQILDKGWTRGKNAHQLCIMSTKWLLALQSFAATLTEKFQSQTAGEPEDQLKMPCEVLFKALGPSLGLPVLAKGEHSIQGIGRPDLAIECQGVLAGFVELKAPDKPANPELFKKKEHDGQQWERFKKLPNLVYTNGKDWYLFRDGVQVGEPVHLGDGVMTKGAKSISAEHSAALSAMLGNFITWSPQVPAKPKELAAFLAPHCRLLRDEVMDACQRNSSSIIDIRDSVKALLFPEASDAQFADAYAQTILFSLLLAHCGRGCSLAEWGCGKS